MVRPQPSAAALALALTACACFAQTAELKLDDIIKKSVDAQGGFEKIRAIKSMKMTGKIVLGGGQMEAPIVSYMKRPHSNRSEILLQGQKIIEGYDGSTKWSINPLMGGNIPQKANEQDTKAAADESDILEGPLVNYKEKGNTAELLGKEDVENSPAYKIKATLKSGNVQTIFIDSKSFLVVKTIAKIKRQGQEFEAETLPGNYKPVDGVLLPFTSEMRVNKQTGMQMQFDRIETNVPIDDSLFAMPEARKAPQQ